MTVPRRDFLATLGAAFAFRRLEHLVAAQLPPPFPGGRLARTMPLGRFDGQPSPPLGRLLDTGLDARLFTDLSTLDTATLVTPADRFFVRTAASEIHRQPESWILDLGGEVRRASRLAIDELRALARPMGTHVMECSGNSDPANFGLLSAARWTGVPVAAVLDRMEPSSDATRVRVSGLDPAANSQSSVAGASWVFSRTDLERAGAFLALGMNDSSLAPDHGAPVRLVVPNWYGCTCIKWMTRIDLVPGSEPATTQMREFAARTHQNGVPARAADFLPAVIELAATPVRVEKWMVDGRVRYRVIGIRWGGATTTNRLTIRFKHTEPFVPVDDSPMPDSMTTWSLWSHTWRPASPGRYQIALGAGDKNIPARRLEVFYYTREVQIDQI
jgi:DMSO/TMAO reductase YedYZ molybdopterin-dependent catalytic subunit